MHENVFDLQKMNNFRKSVNDPEIKREASLLKHHDMSIDELKSKALNLTLTTFDEKHTSMASHLHKKRNKYISREYLKNKPTSNSPRKGSLFLNTESINLDSLNTNIPNNTMQHFEPSIVEGLINMEQDLETRNRSQLNTNVDFNKEGAKGGKLSPKKLVFLNKKKNLNTLKNQTIDSANQDSASIVSKSCNWNPYYFQKRHRMIVPPTKTLSPKFVDLPQI